MVTFIPENPSFGAQISRGLGQGLSQGFLEAMQTRRQQKNAMQQMMQEQALKQSQGKKMAQALGLPEDIVDPGLQKELLKQKRQDDLMKQLLGGSFGEGENESGISDANIAALSVVQPNLAKVLQQQKEHTPEFQRQKKLTEAQATADVKYNQQLQEATKQHEIKTQALNRLEKLNRQGITGKPYEKLLEKFGLVALTSEGRREFAADVKNLITDIRSILGSQFSQFEFQTILNAYPSADFSKEANEAIIKNLKNFQEIRHQEFEIANQLKKSNKGHIPEDFQSQVNEKLQQYIESRLPQIKENMQTIINEEYDIPKGHTLMFDGSGEPLSVPNDQINSALEMGAMLP